MKAQIKLMRLRSKPLDLKKRDTKSVKDITDVINELIRLYARRELESGDMRAIIDALELLTRICRLDELEEMVNEALKKTEVLREEPARIEMSRGNQSADQSYLQPDSSGLSATG
jgi:hypothetical protein